VVLPYVACLPTLHDSWVSSDPPLFRSIFPGKRLFWMGLMGLFPSAQVGVLADESGSRLAKKGWYDDEEEEGKGWRLDGD